MLALLAAGGRPRVQVTAGPAVVSSFPWLALAVALSTALPAQRGKADPGVDPFTQGDPELMAACGIEAYAPMPWAGTHNTIDIETEIGKHTQLCFAETRHFKIGIGLAPRPWPKDKDEKKAFNEEFKAMQERIPKLRRPRAVTSWLLVHFYAQRLEQLYADFCERTGYEDRAPPCADGHGLDGTGWADRGGLGVGPYLGQHGKYCLLIFEKRSDLARYLRRFGGREADESTCHHFLESNSLVFVTTPDLRTQALSTERALYCNVVYGMVRNFVTGYGGYTFEVPVWNVEGLAHWYRRRLDENHNSIAALPESQWALLNDADWAAKARGRVNTGAFEPASELLGWHLDDIHNFHRHVMMWARMDFLQSLGSDKFATYIKRLKSLPPSGVSGEQVLAQQLQALQEAYGFDAEGFDAAWTEWVRDNYDR